MIRPLGARRLFRIPRFGRRQLERELDEEIAFHIAARAERLRASGLSAAEAYVEAARLFGDRSTIRSDCLQEEETDLRRERTMDVFEHTIGDLRFAWRSLRRAPGFAITALLTLTLGIAAASTIYTYYDASYHGALPYHDASRLVAFTERHTASHSFAPFAASSPAVLRLVRRSGRSFERVSAYESDQAVLVFGTEPQAVAGLNADSAFFPLFDLHPELGRLPSAEETIAGASLAVISDLFWRTRYGADDDVLAQSIVLHGKSFRVVGVLPPGFRFPDQTDFIVPLAERVIDTTSAASLEVVAKLRLGASRDGARAELAVLSGRLARADVKRYADVQLTLADEPLDRRGRNFLPEPTAFLFAGFLVLLIACANVANLFYVRAAERRGEMAIRASLGAGYGRLLRQALVESTLLSVTAAIAGTLVAFAAVKLFLHTVPTTGFPSWFHVAIDRRVLAFAAATAVITTLVAGLAPANEATRFDLVRSLKGGADAGASRRLSRRSRTGLVIQLALSTALLVSAMLFVRSYGALFDVDFGYPAARIALVYPIMLPDRYPDAFAQTRLATDVVDRASSMPNVAHAAVLGDGAHLRGIPDSVWAHRAYSTRLIPDGDTTRAVVDFDTRVHVVSDEYFAILRLRTRAGRTFGVADPASAAPVAVISARAADLLWPHQTPLGHALQVGRDGERLTVVGVVDDTRDLGGNRTQGRTVEPRATVYLSTRQAVSSNPEIVASGSADVLTVRSAVIGALHQIDPTMLLAPRETTLASSLDQMVLVTRVFGGIVAALALVALLLATIGIYGVVAFGIAQRTREIGIRIAVGAAASDVVRLIVRETMRFTSVGLIVGLVLATLGGRMLRIFLFGVSPLDPIAFGAVAVFFAAIALVAAYLPARRVARVNPVSALRAE